MGPSGASSRRSWSARTGRGCAWALLLALSLTVGCERATEDGAAPDARIQTAVVGGDARGAWVRVTPSGLEALPDALRAEVGAEAGSPTRFAIPRSRHGDLTVCTGGDCVLELALDALSVSPRADGSLGVSVSARANTGDVAVRYEQSWACAFSGEPVCNVGVDTSRAGPTAITASADLELSVDRRSRLTRVGVARPRVVRGIDGGDVRIAGVNACGQVWCSVGHVLGAGTWLADLGNAAMEDAIRSEVGARTCLGCDGGCPAGSRCVDGLCQDGNGRCLPRPLATGVFLDAHTPVGADASYGATLGLALADVAEVRRGGLDLAVRLAARVDARHRCAPAVPMPAHRPLPQSVLEDAADDRVHLRLVLGQSTLDRALWALHQGGVGCVEVTGEAVPELAAGMLGALLPSLGRLAPLGFASPSLAVRPHAPPQVAIGDDGSLEVTAEGVQLDVEARVDGRRLRLASARVRLRGEARLTMSGGAPSLALPRESLSFEVDEVWGAALLGASETELRGAFEALAGLAQSVVPPTVAFDRVPIPGRLVLAGVNGREVGRTRALVVDLRLEPGAPRGRR